MAVKRLIDIIIAGIGLAVLAPLMVVVALLIKAQLGSPILFRQMRPGYKGAPFQLYKFRTMTDAHDLQGNSLPDSQRRWRWGDLLRSTSMDELPELINVIKGEMSLVGPRPLLIQYLDRYSPEQARRHCVKPGLTGWAQVNGRNAISWEDKFRLDVWYVDNWSIGLDLKILCMTVIKVFKREGIDADGCISMPEFLGSSNHPKL